MAAEILFKVGNGSKFTDGMPIAVKGEGFLITPAHLQIFIQTGVLPPGFLALDENEQDLHLRRLKQIRYLTKPATTAQDVADLRGVSLVLAQSYIDQAVADRAKMAAHGYDTNWGFGDLKLFGVLRADLPPDVAEDLIKQKLDEARHPYEREAYTKVRRWRIPYENLLSAEVVTKLQTPGLLVPVDRAGAIFTPAQIKEAV